MTATVQTISEILNTLTQENQLAPNLESSTQSYIRANITRFTDNSRNSINPNGWSTFYSIEEEDTNSLLSKINTGGKNYKSLINMTTLEKAQIVPKINLFKVIVEGDSRKQVGEIPISFPDNSKTNIQELIQSRGQRGDDVAIKSFTFDFKNQNPFGAGRIVDCNLLLTMMNGESLVKDRGNGFTFSDLILRNNRLDDEKFDSAYYEIKANVGYELPPGNFNSSLRADLRETQVSMSLILVDYDLSFQQNGVIQLSLQYRARVEQVLETPLRYNIFKEQEIALDPTLKPKIASLEKDLVADDARLKGTIAAIKAKEGALEETEEVSKTGYNTAVSGFGDDVFTTTQEYQYKAQVLSLQGEDRKLTESTLAQLKEYADELKIGIPDKQNKLNALNNQTLFMQSRNRVATFNKLLSNMFKSGKIYRLAVDRKDMLLYGEAYAKVAKKRNDLYMRDFMGEFEDTNSEFELLGGRTYLEGLDDEERSLRREAEERLLQQIRGNAASNPVTLDLEGEFTKAAEDIADKKANGNITSDVQFEALQNFNPSEYVGNAANATMSGEADSVSADRGKKIIYWFYYGDLIDEAFKINNVHIRMKEDQIVSTLGSFSLSDPDDIVSKKQINIADIPITLDIFIEFFKTNVIEAARDLYPASDFIRDTIQRLVMPAINKETFGNPQRESRVLKVSTFDLPGTKSGERYVEPISSGLLGAQKIPVINNTFASATLYNARFKMEDLLDRFGNNSLLAKRKSSERFSYMIFYANSPDAVLDWNGSVQEDAKRGVYHFYIGADRGLIKEINFRKSQRPGLAEMMAERSLRAGNRRAELWRNFEADISMIGNSLLKPGCFLYINPTVAGLGNPGSKDSLSRQMGLGGYYFVLGVSNEITDSGWNTQVRAVWQSARA